MKEPCVIGSRGSDLALWQANFVKGQLERLEPGVSFEIRIITTTGDHFVDTALSKIGDKGLFTRQIETELLNGRIDIAVHSLKDLQTVQPNGLVIGAVCEREIPNDALLSKSAVSIERLPEGATVATGSLRRRSQLLAYRPDLKVEEIRGNVPTRLRKFDESDLDGMILAYAGLNRLGYRHRIAEVIPIEIMLPAVGQGAVAVEVRENDEQTRSIAAKLDHKPTRICIAAERAFLRRLEGGCQVPIGALAVLEDRTVRLEGVVGSLDGKVNFRKKLDGPIEEAEALGTRLAEILIGLGANELLENVRIQSRARTVL